MKRDVRATLIERRSLSPDASLLTLTSEHLAETVAPGQFTMVRVPGESGLLLRRPYSFCDVDRSTGRFTLLVKEVGKGTKALARLAIGDEVDCLGPLGTTFGLPTDDRRAVIVAGGVGIAPFIAFCRVLAERGQAATVLLGGRTRHDLYMRDTFEELGMDVRCTTEDGSFGTRGLVTALLDDAVDDSAELYSCGPQPMLVAVAARAVALGVPHQVSIERRMGCGMGCCLGCVVYTSEYVRGCTEGPVFDASDIVWERDPHPL